MHAFIIIYKNNSPIFRIYIYIYIDYIIMCNDIYKFITY